MIPRELEPRIVRLFHVEHWPVRTIARELGIHHSAVERVLDQAGVPRVIQVRASMVDPFVPFIREQWERHPRLTASRLWRMCRERGYAGHPDHFRHAVARHRPRPHAEAYLRLRTLPGDRRKWTGHTSAPAGSGGRSGRSWAW